MTTFAKMAAYWQENLAELNFDIPQPLEAERAFRYPADTTQESFEAILATFTAAMSETQLATFKSSEYDVIKNKPNLYALPEYDFLANQLFYLVHRIVSDDPTMELMELLHASYREVYYTAHASIAPYTLCGVAAGHGEFSGQARYVYRRMEPHSPTHDVPSSYIMLEELHIYGTWIPRNQDGGVRVHREVRYDLDNDTQIQATVYEDGKAALIRTTNQWYFSSQAHYEANMR